MVTAQPTEVGSSFSFPSSGLTYLACEPGAKLAIARNTRTVTKRNVTRTSTDENNLMDLYYGHTESAIRPL